MIPEPCAIQYPVALDRIRRSQFETFNGVLAVKKSTANISTLVAVGGSLVALPAAALELGEAQINSSLGQALRVSIAYALAPNETLANTCVSTQVGQPGGGMPRASSSRISVANGMISITGTTVVREPILSMRVNIHCPYAAQLSRDYTLFVDPSGISAQATTAQAAVTTQGVANPQRISRPAAVVATAVERAEAAVPAAHAHAGAVGRAVPVLQAARVAA